MSLDGGATEPASDRDETRYRLGRLYDIRDRELSSVQYHHLRAAEFGLSALRILAQFNAAAFLGVPFVAFRLDPERLDAIKEPLYAASLLFFGAVLAALLGCFITYLHYNVSAKVARRDADIERAELAMDAARARGASTYAAMVDVARLRRERSLLVTRWQTPSTWLAVGAGVLASTLMAAGGFSVADAIVF